MKASNDYAVQYPTRITTNSRGPLLAGSEEILEQSMVLQLHPPSSFDVQVWEGRRCGPPTGESNYLRTQTVWTQGARGVVGSRAQAVS
jgi:hypothetical protein